MYWRSFLSIAGAAFLSFPILAAQSQDALAYKVGRYVWSIEAAHFGGFSAIELGPNGQDFVAVSDRSWFAQGQILRDDSGEIVGVSTGGLHHLNPPDGEPWARYKADSEGLAFAPNGDILVSFEGMHRVFRYDDLESFARPLPRDAMFNGLIPNASLEALAIAADGTIYTMPERSGHLAKPFPIFRFRNGQWDQPFGLARFDDFLPVGADFGPDGKLYILERKFQFLHGFGNRIRRFTVTEQGLENEELVMKGHTGLFQNLEGLSVWRAPNGKIRLTMISDDNFNFLLSTEIVEFEIN